ncbi:RNA 2',3'-cyclic phosphodiesterase [Syntrophomonas erecta]
MRLFVAISIPEKQKQSVLKVQQQIAEVPTDVKWVEYENYHLTLKFLGEVPLADYDLIVKNLELAAAACVSFQIRIKGLGFFPSRNRPRVLWGGIEGEMEKAYFLGDRVDAYLASQGYEPENKRSFHLTLGRIRSNENNSALVEKAYLVSDELHTEPFTINQFHLMESRLSSSGPQYLLKRSFYME